MKKLKIAGAVLFTLIALIGVGIFATHQHNKKYTLIEHHLPALQQALSNVYKKGGEYIFYRKNEYGKNIIVYHDGNFRIFPLEEESRLLENQDLIDLIQAKGSNRGDTLIWIENGIQFKLIEDSVKYEIESSEPRNSIMKK